MRTMEGHPQAFYPIPWISIGIKKIRTFQIDGDLCVMCGVDEDENGHLHVWDWKSGELWVRLAHLLS